MMRIAGGMTLLFLLVGCNVEWPLHPDAGDADADADGDGDGDADGDSDAGSDADVDVDGDADVDADGDGDGDGDGVGEWITLRAGTFTMGSPVGEHGRELENETQHEVTLTRDFEIRSTEVTQDEFLSLMGYNPSTFAGCANCPAENVTWYEAAAYCNVLSVSASLDECYECFMRGEEVNCDPSWDYDTPYECPGYRLPTEAEWEYAARAGTTTATYNGDLYLDGLECEHPNVVMDPIAWFCGNSDATTHEVGMLEPNAWGLFDMLGNVWEWTHDCYRDDYPGDETDPWGPADCLERVFRGGSQYYEAGLARAAARTRYYPAKIYYRFGNLGFRPSRSLP